MCHYVLAEKWFAVCSQAHYFLNFLGKCLSEKKKNPMTSQQSPIPQKNPWISWKLPAICANLALFKGSVNCALLHSSPPCFVPFFLFQHGHPVWKWYTNFKSWSKILSTWGIINILSEVSYWKHYFGFRAGLAERMSKEKQGQLQLFVGMESCSTPCQPHPCEEQL